VWDLGSRFSAFGSTDELMTLLYLVGTFLRVCFWMASGSDRF
jgi:hypothetical protein